MKEVSVKFIFTIEDAIDTVMYMVKEDIEISSKHRVMEQFKKLVSHYGVSYPSYIGSFTDTERTYAAYKTHRLFPEMYERLEEVRRVINEQCSNV